MRQLTGPLPPTMAARVASLQELFTLLHWGIPSLRVLQTSDASLPDLVQMGRLLELELQVQGGGKQACSFPEGSHLGVEYELPEPGYPVDPTYTFSDEALQRLHLLVPDDARAAYQRAFERAPGTETLSSLARRVGGRQARFPYPRRRATLWGEATKIIYGTEKKGDGPSDYYHLFRDEYGRNPHHRKPWLALDETGQPWLVGGDYTVPPEGITG